MEVIKSLKNRGTILKGTTEKIISQEGGLFGNIFPSLMNAGLTLIQNELTALSKSVLIQLRLKAAASATDTTIQKKIMHQA